MAGKRYRHRVPNISFGGLIQFEDGYYPPLDQPPEDDPGIQAMIEGHQHFGWRVWEVDPQFTMKAREETSEHATPREVMIAKAERVVAKMKAAQPPKPKRELPDYLPSKYQFEKMKKAELVEWIERLDLKTAHTAKYTRPKLIEKILAHIKANTVE